MGIGDELVKNKLKKQLKKLGYDLNKPRETTIKIIREQIQASVGNYITKKEMIQILQDHINNLKNDTT